MLVINLGTDVPMRKFISLLILLGLIAGPALAKDTTALDEKYYFDKLETVDRFHNWSINGWNVIDQRSLIVHSSPSKAYLIILDRRLWDLRFTETIAISSTASSIHAGFDTVHVINRHGINIPARIVKIYHLEGKEQRRQVRDQILDS